MRLVTPLLFLCMLLGIAACGSDPDLQAIRANIKAISIAAEQHDSNAILDYVDPGYKGVGGNKDGVRAILSRHFELNRNINIIISDINIVIAEDRQSAKVNVRVLMTGGDGNLPERGRLSAINSTWEKRDNEWRVTRAGWKPVLIAL